MPSPSSDARFLGIDFQALLHDMRKSWQGMHQWPILAWLTPAVPVRLLQANGGESLWLGGVEQPQNVQSRVVRFVAVELPEQSVLRRSLHLPSMGEADAASAVALDVRSASPFALDDLVWGFHAGPLRQGMRKIDLAFASRKQVAQYLATQTARLPTEPPPEVWVCTAHRSPIVFTGYGEGLRTAYATRRRHVGYALLLLVVVLLTGMAATPTAQLRLRAMEAVHAYETIVQQTAPLVRQREELLQSAEQLGSLAEVLAGRIEPLRVLDKLTQLLPDDTSVQSFRLQGAKVTLVGLTANASTLMQLLSDQAGLHDVRAPSAATRIPGALKESFVIEFSLDPQLYGVVSSPVLGASSTPTPTSVDASAAAPATTPQEPASNTQSMAAPARAASGAATFGGGAVFGGSGARSAPKQDAAPVPTPRPSP